MIRLGLKWADQRRYLTRSHSPRTDKFLTAVVKHIRDQNTSTILGDYLMTASSKKRQQYPPFSLRCILWLMHSRAELRTLTYKKIRTIKRLIRDGEWEVAAYLMGYVLECALKAASCRALKLPSYPPVKSRGEVVGFMTHEFEQLLAVSGLSDLFGSVTTSPAYANWSAFTINYPGSWTGMRYKDVSDKFDESTVKELAKNLYDDGDSIIQTIKRKKRW